VPDGSVVLMLVLPLPFFGMVLRDYAATPFRPVQPIGIVLLGLAGVGLVWLLRWQYPSLCGWVALLLLVASVMLLRQRWQKMLQAPVAFPTGRLAA